MTIIQWQTKWQISAEAMKDLDSLELSSYEPNPSSQDSEARTQDLIRLEASRQGILLWRNNNGAFKTEDGRFVRCGLANDSSAMNARIKSSDLVGIKPVIITHDMVGRTIGQFIAREVKKPNWKFSKNDKHSQAQKKFMEIINKKGGDAKFAQGVDDV